MDIAKVRATRCPAGLDCSKKTSGHGALAETGSARTVSGRTGSARTVSGRTGSGRMDIAKVRATRCPAGLDCSKKTSGHGALAETGSVRMDFAKVRATRCPAGLDCSSGTIHQENEKA